MPVQVETYVQNSSYAESNRTDSEVIIQAGGIIKKNYSKAKMHDISKQNKSKSMIRKLRCDTAQDAVASQPEYCIA